jgi:ATP-dependent exoDNAse (exonuclease V) alpha subunit
MIEGQAGTGKSTALIGIARAHQSAGRQIIVISTAAIAAERLTGELAENGVDAHAFSTVALDNAIRSGQLRVGSQTTIIHDEAALASTREQLNLLSTVERSGSRLIAVGDPQQSQPVGAGGLWHHLEDQAREADVHAELTVNQRAQDPADRRDQRRFRDGQHELAIRGYAARDRIHLDPDRTRAEDRALEAAHADRAAGFSTIVVAQTSNDHLDQLNARAQAIRLQNHELGREHLPSPGAPTSCIKAIAGRSAAPSATNIR